MCSVCVREYVSCVCICRVCMYFVCGGMCIVLVCICICVVCVVYVYVFKCICIYMCMCAFIKVCVLFIWSERFIFLCRFSFFLRGLCRFGGRGSLLGMIYICFRVGRFRVRVVLNFAEY